MGRSSRSHRANRSVGCGLQRRCVRSWLKISLARTPPAIFVRVIERLMDQSDAQNERLDRPGVMAVRYRSVGSNGPRVKCGSCMSNCPRRTLSMHCCRPTAVSTLAVKTIVKTIRNSKREGVVGITDPGGRFASVRLRGRSSGLLLRSKP
jgi:hypothetical protein